MVVYDFKGLGRPYDSEIVLPIQFSLWVHRGTNPNRVKNLGLFLATMYIEKLLGKDENAEGTGDSEGDRS